MLIGYNNINDWISITNNLIDIIKIEKTIERGTVNEIEPTDHYEELDALHSC